MAKVLTVHFQQFLAVLLFALIGTTAYAGPVTTGMPSGGSLGVPEIPIGNSTKQNALAACFKIYSSCVDSVDAHPTPDAKAAQCYADIIFCIEEAQKVLDIPCAKGILLILLAILLTIAAGYAIYKLVQKIIETIKKRVKHWWDWLLLILLILVIIIIVIIIVIIWYLIITELIPVLMTTCAA